MPTTLTLTPTPEFTLKDIELKRPGEKPMPIELTFKRMRKTPFEAWLKLAAEQNRKDRDLVAEVLVGWDGPDKPFSPEALEDLFEEFFTSSSDLLTLYCDAMSGRRMERLSARA